jgi:hypothetical protein
MRAKIDGSGTGETLMLSMLTELTSEPGVISTSKLLIGLERKGAKPTGLKPPGAPPKLGIFTYLKLHFDFYTRLGEITLALRSTTRQPLRTLRARKACPSWAS